MRTLVAVFTVLIILLALNANLAEALSDGHDRYRTITTPRGEVVDVADAGIYMIRDRPLN